MLALIVASTKHKGGLNELVENYTSPGHALH